MFYAFTQGMLEERWDDFLDVRENRKLMKSKAWKWGAMNEKLKVYVNIFIKKGQSRIHKNVSEDNIHDNS